MTPITFLSDYGLRDEYVGVCHGVIAQLAPAVRIIDLTHGIPAGDVQAGALALRHALPFLPRDAIHMAIVDPGVGSERRPLALRCNDGAIMVGPDNGLLWLAAEDRGGIEVATNLSDSPHRIEPVSATFHGRDLFAPVATRLALDVPVELAGEPIDPETVERLELPKASVGDGHVEAHVMTVDGYGNLQLDATPDQLVEAGFAPGDRITVEQHEATYGRTFADAEPGALVAYVDSTGSIAIGANGASAAELLGAPATVVLAQ